MDLGLDGRVELVTGGSKGIGRACAEGLAAEGCRVAICARGATALGAVARDLAEPGALVITIAADLSEKASASRVVGEVVHHFGRLDILVNNAGAIRDGGFLETAVSVWEHENVIGTAARNPVTTFMAGGIANAGLINFTRALADLGAPDRILVTAVSPGPIAIQGPDRGAAVRSTTHPLGRMGTPQDVADLVTFLASERASFISGVAITVDAGASRGVYL